MESSFLQEILPSSQQRSRLCGSVIARIGRSGAFPLQAEHTLTPALQAYKRCLEEYAAKAIQFHEAQERCKRDMERFRVWSEYSKQQRGVQTIEMALTSLGGMLRSLSDADRASMQAGKLPTTIVARSAWFWFVRDFGHRALGEGDIAMLRFEENLATSVESALTQAPMKSFAGEFGEGNVLTWKARLFAPLWDKYCAILQNQEQTRSQIMKQIAEARATLLVSAHEYTLAGILPNETALWAMSLDDIANHRDMM